MSGVFDTKVKLIGVDNISAPVRRAQKTMQDMNVVAERQKGIFVRHKRTIQQAGFQVGDFAVQIAGGQSAMLAFTQQGSQMLQFFGAFGAAAAGVLSVAGSIAVAFLRSGKMSKNFKGELKDMNKILGESGDVLRAVTLDADELRNRFAGTLAEIRGMNNAIAILQFNDLSRGVDQIAQAFVKAQSQSTRWFQMYRYDLGVSREALVAINKELVAFSETDSINKRLTSVRKMRELFVNSTKDIRNLTDAQSAYLAKLLDAESALARAVKIQNDLARSITQSSDNVTMLGERYTGVLNVLTSIREIISIASDRTQVWAIRAGALADKFKEAFKARLDFATLSVNNGLAADSAGQSDLISGKDTPRVPELLKVADAVKKVGGAATKAAEQVREVGAKVTDFASSVKNAVTSGIGGVFDAIVDKSKSVGDALRSLGAELAKLVAKKAFFDLLGRVAPGIFGKGGFVSLANANGNAFSGGNVIPFARGGVVSGPTVFPMAKGTGLMGEAGPEAILPLSRGRGGRLGVAAPGGGGTVIQIVNNSSASVQHRETRTDNGQTIERLVIESVNRGAVRGDLDSSMGGRFGNQPSKVVR